MKKHKKIISIVVALAIIIGNISITVDAAAKFKQYSPVGSIKKSNAYKKYQSFFSRVNFTSEKNFIVPGLNTNMTPQGMCDIGDYILISAYDHSKKSNSCIHVIKKSNGKIAKTLYIKGNKTHVGGLAYDGKYVWVANSTNSTLGRISASDIKNKKDNSTISATNFSVTNEKGQKITASFATYSNKTLWVGVFTEKSNSYAYGYTIGSSKLTLKYKVQIPDRIQGMVFDSKGNLILSQSYGRNNPSKILTYDKLSYKTVGKRYEAKLGKVKYSLTAPPTSQNMFIGKDNLLYILFESAAKCYYEGTSNKAKEPVDRVCAIKIAN